MPRRKAGTFGRHRDLRQLSTVTAFLFEAPNRVAHRSACFSCQWSVLSCPACGGRLCRSGPSATQRSATVGLWRGGDLRQASGGAFLFESLVVVLAVPYVFLGGKRCSCSPLPEIILSLIQCSGYLRMIPPRLRRTFVAVHFSAADRLVGRVSIHGPPDMNSLNRHSTCFSDGCSRNAGLHISAQPTELCAKVFVSMYPAWSIHPSPLRGEMETGRVNRAHGLRSFACGELAAPVAKALGPSGTD